MAMFCPAPDSLHSHIPLQVPVTFTLPTPPPTPTLQATPPFLPLMPEMAPIEGRKGSLLSETFKLHSGTERFHEAFDPTPQYP